MLYIVTALKPEAQAFVDKYKLTKTKHGNITLFVGSRMKVILTGLGIHNAKTITTKFINDFKPSCDDIFLNIGICGANKEHNIGKLIHIGSIIYKEQLFTIDSRIKNTITCKDSEVSNDTYIIVDMESYGFYEATKNIKNRYIFKVVSDHFEPSKVTKEHTKMLIFNAIEDIMKKVYR